MLRYFNIFDFLVLNIHSKFFYTIFKLCYNKKKLKYLNVRSPY